MPACLPVGRVGRVGRAGRREARGVLVRGNADAVSHWRDSQSQEVNFSFNIFWERIKDSP
ncbi:hypothetical protein A3H03_03580 [Candidatus Kuenenbacteria bacterium RIFCSPLOWO2_12_FULL_42_13]|uniref:Uncharacterized protein n=2 Tax=Candidatus Kueneniibacteriota TaxID=1752740 RepID=A0A1F6G2X0_9BACT|nr:MAG: hypothetical protein A3H55_03260 [Candidatus Kuenenbacteria bacterium RIFCSPLOWO2_02_FULL_42_16]OGG92461.1 MAG: hypothetical protein A3H03_03580 [Candidatus Kuenenbacteria bacterium RIFCSPLOWO2_12_FULL_42_13]